MKGINLLFLGTCACDFTDKLKNEFKDKFDYDSRRASAFLIGGRYLIDAGMHILDSIRIAKVDITKITDIFVTHLHGDHFDRDNIAKIAAAKDEPLNIWVRDNADFEEIENTVVHKMEQFCEYSPSDEIKVTGIPANHPAPSCPQHFVITVGEKKIFYGCDGAWMLLESYRFLKNANIDFAVFDCTVGDYLGDFRMAEHNSIPMLRVMLPSLYTVGALSDNTEIYLSHLAPSLHKPHRETEVIAKGFGAKVAYDGLEITL